MFKNKFKPWEVAILIASLVVFTASAWMYVTSFPLSQLLFDVESSAPLGAVGRMSEDQGTVQRESVADPGFRPLESGATLFDRDTIVTGPRSSAKLELDNGSSLDLGPDTMIRLSFEPRLSWSGIARTATVAVVKGQVEGKAASAPIIVRPADRPSPEFRIENRSARKVSIVELKPVPKPPSIWKRLTSPASPPTPTPASTSRSPSPAPTSSPTPSPSPTTTATPSPTPIQSPSTSPSPRPLPSPSPSPSPSPTKKALPKVATKIRWLKPEKNTVFRIGRIERATLSPKVNIELSWDVVPIYEILHLSVRHLSSGQLVLDQDVQPIKGRGEGHFVATMSGQYEASLQPRGPTAEPPVKRGFEIDPRFSGIELEEPLVAGQKMASNQVTGKRLQSFDITLKWKPYGQATNYEIKVGRSADIDNTQALTNTVTGTSYKLNRERVFTGKAFYKVYSKLPGGFVVSSEVGSFAFDFLPPIPVMPSEGTTITPEKSDADQQAVVLVTWQSTNFTEGYQLQIARTSDFTKPIIDKKTSENFLLMRNPAPGQYYWRIRSVSKALSSNWSRTTGFKVTGVPQTQPVEE